MGQAKHKITDITLQTEYKSITDVSDWWYDH